MLEEHFHWLEPKFSGHFFIPPFLFKIYRDMNQTPIECCNIKILQEKKWGVKSKVPSFCFWFGHKCPRRRLLVIVFDTRLDEWVCKSCPGRKFTGQRSGRDEQTWLNFPWVYFSFLRKRTVHSCPYCKWGREGEKIELERKWSRLCRKSGPIFFPFVYSVHSVNMLWTSYRVSLLFIILSSVSSSPHSSLLACHPSNIVALPSSSFSLVFLLNMLKKSQHKHRSYLVNGADGDKNVRTSHLDPFDPLLLSLLKSLSLRSMLTASASEIAVSPLAQDCNTCVCIPLLVEYLVFETWYWEKQEVSHYLSQLFIPCSLLTGLLNIFRLSFNPITSGSNQSFTLSPTCNRINPGKWISGEYDWFTCIELVRWMI